MKTEYIIIWAVLFSVFLLLGISKLRTYLAIQKVRKRSDEIKITELNEAVSPFGYLYEHKQDLFFTSLHPWQRKMGYSRLYDESAMSFGMVIQCEPIEFRCYDKLYLIEFWKGQYGMTTGAEVGMYQAEESSGYKKGDYVFYESITDEQMLPISMTLYKKGKTLVTRSDRHWWLTVFKLGEYSAPEALSLRVNITFRDYMMRNAYVDALLDVGYSVNEIRIRGLMVSVLFHEPKTRQPLHKRKMLRRFVAKANRYMCRRYMKRTDYFERSLDRIDFLRHRYTVLAFFALRFSKMTKRAVARADKRAERCRNK